MVYTKRNNKARCAKLMIVIFIFFLSGKVGHFEQIAARKRERKRREGKRHKTMRRR